MKKQICRNFASKGTCEFGLKCHFLHITQTYLLDPPTWIFSHFNGSQEFSPEEVRAFYYDSKVNNRVEEFANEHDKLWINNYNLLCDELNKMEKGGEIVSDSDRSVDVRQEPGIFNKMFFPERMPKNNVDVNKRVEPMIIEEKKTFVNRNYNREVYDGRRSDSNYESTHKYNGYKGRDDNYTRRNEEYKGNQQRYTDDYDKGRKNDNYKDYRSYNNKTQNYNSLNKYDDKNNVYGKGNNDIQNDNVVYDRFGNIVNKNRDKKNLDTMFDDEKPNTYFKK